MLTITLLLSLILPSLLAISVLSLVVIATDTPFVSKVYAHFIGGDTKVIDNRGF
jgi:hypothetical protein